jgi:AAA+ superfamily predicted ATPase
MRYSNKKGVHDMTDHYEMKNTAKSSVEIQDVFSGDFPFESRIASYALQFLKLKIRPLEMDFYKMVLEVLSKADLETLTRNLVSSFPDNDATERLRENVDDAEDVHDLTRAFQAFGRPSNSKQGLAFTQELIRLLKKMIHTDPLSYQRRCADLSRKLNLGPHEMSLLELGCCYGLNQGLEGFVDSYNLAKKAGLFSYLTGIPRSTVGSIISSKSPLAKNDLLTFNHRCVSIEDSVSEYLLGNAGKSYAMDSFCPLESPSVPLKNFELKDIQKTLLVKLLSSKSPTNILLHGKAGSGKTELAKALVAHCNKNAVLVSYECNGKESARKMSLVATANSVSEDTVIIIDEVDSLLNTQSYFLRSDVDKGWINHFLDENRHKVIWITNETQRMESSVCRRFSYSLNLQGLNRAQRQTLWTMQLKKHGIKRYFQTDKIEDLARRYPVSPGLITYAINTVSASHSDDMSVKEVHAFLEEVISRQMELTEGLPPSKLLNKINEHYDPHALHTDTDIPKLLNGLEQYHKSDSGFGLSMLFWGWPGTGKTEFGKYIAERLDKELLVKRMSDLQSKWVGETEQQIAAAFREAEENDAILFLDEADSLFIDRKTARASWESAQTNEVLTQMENFKGILICCTNLLDHLDTAALRRFAFKVKFKPLTEVGRLSLYREYFKGIKGRFTPELKEQLNALTNLCPGDIRAVWQRIGILGQGLNHKELLKELEKEVGYKQELNPTRIGF